MNKEEDKELQEAMGDKESELNEDLEDESKEKKEGDESKSEADSENIVQSMIDALQNLDARVSQVEQRTADIESWIFRVKQA